ncbi:BUD2 GTPase activating protein BUD2 [Candida maltosa Xu316]
MSYSSSSYPTAFHKIISRDKGVFEGHNFLISSDTINWIHIYTLTITELGQLYSSDEHDDHYLLLKSLQSCYVQIYPSSANPINSGSSNTNINHQNNTSNNNNTNDSSNGSNDDNDIQPPIIFIKTFENDKLYIKIPSKSNFGTFLSCLIVWQNLKPQGLAKKWYSENKVLKNSSTTTTTHELLVCRFKIYGPIPNKYKNLNIVPGPKAPIYQPKIEDNVNINMDNNNMISQQIISNDNNNSINEGWFYTMGALNSNGILNFISELDGTLLYSVDIKLLMSSEIREVHNSIFNSSNVLFLGQLKELRYNNIIRTQSTLTPDQLLTPFLLRDGKFIANNQRILIEFPLHIDLEDWFVGLNYFAKREYIGSFDAESKLVNEVEYARLSDFNKANFRVSKKVSIDIIEAKFENETGRKPGKIYAEVRMWGYPWSRTATVDHVTNPFWKEEFSTDLPISTQMIHILIKKCTFNDSSYSVADKLIGTVYVTPDILTKQIKTSSTIMTSNESNQSIQVNSIPIANSQTNQYSNLDIVRLTIYDPNNIPIGKLLLQVNLKEYHILAPAFFKPLEKMLVNAPMKDLIKFCNENVPTSDFERVSLILLDIFQSLGVEDDWFKSLMESELVNIDIMTRKNYHQRNSQDQAISNQKQAASSNNVFNTLFRGSSIFSKSLEKYNLRIGQEYLEKVFGDFFAKISNERKNCEVDPRYVRLQERALRKGKNIDDDLNDNNDSDSDDDDDDDEKERERNERIKNMIEENYANLYQYVEEIWHKIYITSNDLPDQIKLQLKNFRTRIELVCDPEDKITSLNCLSAFIFLRFFCPAILNPKLFYLVAHHQKGTSQRTLTLVAKILLNLANRQEFSPHKEPHLVRMNDFLRNHLDEVYDYFDKITGRKNDFNEKILELSHEVKRFDLGLDKTSYELPTTPYLIDKYLRLTEFVHLLDYTKFKNASNSNASTPVNSPARDYERTHSSTPSDLDPILKLSDLQLNYSENKYQIGSLEFEKSEFLELTGDNETEGFIKSLCKGNEEIFSFINSNITLKDIQKQSTKILKKVHDLEIFLENYEFPINYKDQNLWNLFTYDILNKCWMDVSRNCLIYSDQQFLNSNQYKKLIDHHALAGLKLKFNDHVSHSSNSINNGLAGYTNNNNNTSSGNSSSDILGRGHRVSSSFSTNSIGSVVKSGSGSKNPFKKWLRKS